MKIFICSSKHLYHLIPPVKGQLENMGHEVTLPNCYDDPMLEERIKEESKEKHAKFKSAMFKEQEEKIRATDAILVMNYEKGRQPNYIGGATFLEIFKAWELEKRIYLMNPIPDNIFKDELEGMCPIILYQDLSKII